MNESMREEFEAWKAEELALMNPLMNYARSVCTGPLGCSITEWLVEDHKEQALEIERLTQERDSQQRTCIRAMEELDALKTKQCPVVMPIRADSVVAASGYHKGWNACLDEVARLNQPASAALSANHSELVREVPSNCRQRLVAEGKAYPKSSCAVCGQFSPKWRECDAMLTAPSAGSQKEQG